MAKALFLSLPLTGHINPSLALVRELAGRGDEVVYYATSAFETKIAESGALYRPYRSVFLAELRGLPERLHELSSFLMRTTAEILGQELEGFRAERPDYIITDSVAPWGCWAGKLLGVPVVTSISTFALNRQVSLFAVAHGIRPASARVVLSKVLHVARALLIGRELRRRYAIKNLGMKGLLFPHSDLNVVYTSRYFQPCANSFDNRFHFTGPSVTDRRESDDFPWEQLRHPVIVYASLGTLFNADDGFYRACFTAFKDQDCQVILSTGANVSAESLGPAPANFIVRSHVPQLEVLRRATVFVTHGGMNSVSESLYHGVPVVVVPQMSEQALVGRRVEDLGAGLYLAKQEVTAEKLRDSVQRLLVETRFRDQAALVRESFLAAGGVASAADAIVAFTR
ncbi:MAG: glycosyl transferase [Bryobacteraceae bacterium]|nr:glycosyl transferase [Bryobacteraceae bacterium]